jgi:diguanylate cyclase (GGDEF)-like protein
MNRKTLQNSWLIISILLILSIGFISISMLSYIGTRDYVIHNEKTQSLPLISDNIYSEIKKELVDPINTSSLMSHDTFLINWVLADEQDLNAITEYLSTIKEEYNYTSAFYVSDITGNYYYYDGILKQLSTDDAHDVWYYRFKDLNVPFALDVDTDEARQGTLTVFINHRLEKPDGTFLGVTGIGLELNKLGEKFTGYQELFDHEIYMVDTSGLITIHSNPELVEQASISELEGIQNISDDILISEEQIKIFEYENTTGTKIISSRYIPEFNWFLIVEKDQNESLTAARQALYRNMMIGLLITVIVFLIIIWIIRKYNRQLEEMASIDELTELYNRRVFTDLLKREVRTAQRYQQSLGLLMIDIDDFKSVNDTYGHLVGDQLLKTVAKKIEAIVRESDLVGRWGGDEFIVMLHNTGEQEAYQTALRLMKEIEETVLETEWGYINATISVGYANAEKEFNWFELIQKADEALLCSKREGKNRVSHT